ncbi:MAG TPA: FHA domain-containing protein [Polyangia bacterium]
MARLPTGMRGKPLDWGDEEAATRVGRDAASLSLIAREGPLSGHVFGTDGHPITIGRGGSCGVHLALSEISRRHATIRYRAGRYWVEDLQTLNGTRVNQQLIDGPTALQHGDRIHVGAQEFEVRLEALANRQVVYDGPNSEALSVPRGSQAPQAPQTAYAGPARWPLGPVGFAIVAMLAISTGVLLAYAITRDRRHAQAPLQASAGPAASGPAAAGSAASAASTSRPAAVAPVRARFEVDGAVAFSAPEAGTVQWVAARGTRVHAGDELFRIRPSNAAKQRELDRINAELEENDSDAALGRRAHALAVELLDAPESETVKSSFDGIVVATPSPRAHVAAGAGEVRVARAVRVVLDASAVAGAGSACRVSFLDQHVAAEGQRVEGNGGTTIQLSRFPPSLSLDEVGRARADCQ